MLQAWIVKIGRFEIAVPNPNHLALGFVDGLPRHLCGNRVVYVKIFDQTVRLAGIRNEFPPTADSTIEQIDRQRERE